MELLEYNFMGGAYEGRSAKQNAQQCINFYPVLDRAGGMVKSLYPTPGLKEWVDVSFDHPTRNLRQSP